MNFKTMSKKEKWILFLLIGVFVAVLFVPMEKKESNVQMNTGNADENIAFISEKIGNMAEYEEVLSNRLISILEKIDGAGKVDAWVRISEGKELVLSMEGTEETVRLKEQDSEGGSRTEDKKTSNHNVIMDKNGNPYVIKTLEPKIEGVFVVAEGAGNSTVKKNITEAVEVLFDIDAHRIKVAKKKLEE